MSHECEPKPSHRWFFFDPVVFPLKILFSIGSREEMCRTSSIALSSMSDNITGTEAEFIAKNLNEKFSESDEEIDGEVISVKSGNGTRVHVLRIESFSGTLDDSATLSHECLHVAMAVMDMCGVIESPPYECLCYLHQEIFKKFSTDAFGSCGMLRSNAPSEEERKANEESFRKVD